MNLNVLFALVFAVPCVAALLLLHYAMHMGWLLSVTIGAGIGVIVMLVFFVWLMSFLYE